MNYFPVLTDILQGRRRAIDVSFDQRQRHAGDVVTFVVWQALVERTRTPETTAMELTDEQVRELSHCRRRQGWSARPR